MVRTVFIILFIAVAGTATAQVRCFAEIKLDRHSVYVQQPFRVTITVLTATWYTAPLEFDNIQLPNAFVLSFDQTTPGMFDVRGRQYAGLQFYFIVFPYQAGAFVFPPIDVIAQTPAEGDSKSQKVHIKTPVQHFNVRPVPAGAKNEPWFVAKNVSISEHWSKPLPDLKVGDIIERTVTIRASGTLPQFIPPLPKDSLAFASTYMQDAELKDERNDYDANGSLTQSVIYLMEKEGDFVIPAIPVNWWNPNSNKLYSRSAEAGKIHVKANAELGILATLKDSLATRPTTVVIPTVHKRRQTLFGVAWYWGVLILLGGMWLLYRLSKWCIIAWRTYKKKWAVYLDSERYAFRQWMRWPSTLSSFIRTMYCWWDRLPLRGRSFSIQQQLRKQGYGQTGKDLSGYFQQLYQAGNTDTPVDASFKKEMKAYRDQVIQDVSGLEEGKLSKEQTPYPVNL